MKTNNKKKKTIGSANPIFYGLAYSIVKPIFTKKYNIKYDKKIVKDIKGPAVILASHVSDQDHILSGLTFYPLRPTYIVSEHFMHNKSTAGLIKLFHVISKKMFTPDVSTIINIMRAKKEGNVIVIFPEGRLSCYGHTLPVADGTAELIKKLGVDLYAWKADGAYLTFPKWRDKGDYRKGRIDCSIKKVMSADEVAEKSIDELKKFVSDVIRHDDELAMAGLEYKGEDMSRGAERILFKCPKCLKEGSITTGGGHIRCSCGLDATLDSTYVLHNAPFERLNQWFEWQQASIDIENEVIRSSARLGSCNADGYMDPNAGEGEIYLDKKEFRMKGHIHGEEIEFSVESDKIGAFPVSPGDHFDIYHGGQLIYIYPQPDLNSTMKWACFIDRLNEINNT